MKLGKVIGWQSALDKVGCGVKLSGSTLRETEFRVSLMGYGQNT